MVNGLGEAREVDIGIAGGRVLDSLRKASAKDTRRPYGG